MNKIYVVCAFLAGSSVQSGRLWADSYVQTNLVSDILGKAAFTDPNLKNPWGVSFSAGSPFWVSNQGSGNATLYNGAGTPQALVVTVPPGFSGPTGPTGQVFANLSGNFALGNGNPAVFLFATLDGTITAWNGGTSAQVAYASPTGAVFTGLALANNGSGNFLYAADVSGADIQVFRSDFNLTNLGGSFTDPNLPSGYAPYNIQTIGTNLYVEYADFSSGSPAVGAGRGFVDIFDFNGNFVERLISGGALDAPWGITLAPASFGSFSNDLLVGNFGDGKINAFDPTTGAFLGTLSDAANKPIVNDGLWALEVRGNGGNGSDPNAVYFTAGINGEIDGLFGKIEVSTSTNAVPEPSSWSLFGFVIVAVAALGLRRRCA